MENESSGTPTHAGPDGEKGSVAYLIRVKGCMDAEFWQDWFGEMEITTHAEEGETSLRGPIADQAELYGLLTRLRNRGLTLILVQQESCA